jgi:hypothetical protein
VYDTDAPAARTARRPPVERLPLAAIKPKHNSKPLGGGQSREDREQRLVTAVLVEISEAREPGKSYLNPQN